MTYRIILQPIAREALLNILDQRIQEQIRDRINGLARDPEKQGKPLLGEFFGFRSVRAAGQPSASYNNSMLLMTVPATASKSNFHSGVTLGQRYRVIYKVERQKITVFIVALGIRKAGDKKDIYALAKKLFRLGLLK